MLFEADDLGLALAGADGSDPEAAPRDGDVGASEVELGRLEVADRLLMFGVLDKPIGRVVVNVPVGRPLRSTPIETTAVLTAESTITVVCRLCSSGGFMPANTGSCCMVKMLF